MECEGGVAPAFPSLLELTKAEKCLMDASTGDDMDRLAVRYAGCYRYAKILETVAAGHLQPRILAYPTS